MPTFLPALIAACGPAAAVAAPDHVVVFHRPDTFAGWPANAGLWAWDGGAEALVGFVTAPFKEQDGHNLAKPYTNSLARTRDGGRTWAVEPAPGYCQEGMPAGPLPGRLDFAAPGFAMRVVAEGYQGGGTGGGGVAVSTDRGKTWTGPFALPGLNAFPELGAAREITARTDYLPLGPDGCLVMASARPEGAGKVDRVFAARLTDGGRRAEFVGWVVPPADPDRGVMPATVRGPGDRLVAAVRRRPAGGKTCRIDAYRSDDGGRTWALLGKVADTGGDNGNPPALVRLKDGRLCCAYGNRTTLRLAARISPDDGATWGAEVVLRDGYQPDQFGDADFGYPRMFQRPDGKLVTVYYWADPARPTPHIAATVWTPPAPEPQEASR